MAQPTCFILTTLPLGADGRESLYGKLKTHFSGGDSKVRPFAPLNRSKAPASVQLLGVPTDLRYGTFDDLVRLVDDLEGADRVAERCIRKVEGLLRSDAKDEAPKVSFQKQTFTVPEYISRFVWDEARYPKWKRLREHVDKMLQVLSKTDEDLNNKMGTYNDIRRSVQQGTPSDSLLTMDLVLCLTSDVINDEDYVETEHITTVFVVVPEREQKAFLANYERFCEWVVPRSAKKLNLTDKNNATLWRVVLWSRNLDTFKARAKEYRCTVREHQYSPATYEEALAVRTKQHLDYDRHKTLMGKVCAAAFSELMVVWLHIRVARLYCESALHYGSSPAMAAFVISPIGNSSVTTIQNDLREIALLREAGTVFHDLIGGSADTDPLAVMSVLYIGGKPPSDP